CLALLASSAAQERLGEVLAKGRRFIDQCAASDGSYRLESGREEAVWPTSLVLFTQSVLGASRDVLERTARRLLGLRGRIPDNPEAGEIQDIDLKLTGWPWAENNFSWVEPTSWAILALRAVGQGEHPPVREA